MPHFNRMKQAFGTSMLALSLLSAMVPAAAFDVPVKPAPAAAPTEGGAKPAKRKPGNAPSQSAQVATPAPEPAEDPLIKAQRDMLNLSAQNKYKSGDKTGSLADWRQLEKLGTPTAELYYWIGLVELDLEHPDAADEALKRNIRLSGGQGERYQDVLALMQRSVSVRAALKAKSEQVERERLAAAARAERTKEVLRQADANGGTFKECNVCPQMKVIPAGSFTMGSPGSEPIRQSSEGPQHTVRVASFAAGVFAVTFDEWDACVADGGCDGHRPNDEGWGRGTRPVIHVSWNQAKAYARWVSAKTGQTYRLLTEAEWEYAARAGTSTPFYTGHCIYINQSNYDGNLDYNNCGANTGSYPKQTRPVVSYAPNVFGLHDMAGNVFQWVEDVYHNSYNGAPDDGSAWVTGGDGTWRVIRGGSWASGLSELRSAHRFGFWAAGDISYLGFRIARTL
jgi:formylglycine-generating enzyme required for sulfatase activity